MATLITMPAVLADATEATLQDWLVSVGDTITPGQPLADIETEKATVELEAEAPGTVGRLLVDPGTSVAVGEPIGVLVEADEDEAAIDREIASSSAAVTSSAQQPGLHDSESPSTDRDAREHAVKKSLESNPLSASESRVFISPLARKMAKERGIEVAALNGSGPHGRILRRDVETAGRRDAATFPTTALTSTGALSPPQAHRPVWSETPAEGKFQDLPLSGMRRAIARRLTESKTTVPHFYLSLDVEMDALLALRREINESLEARDQKTTVNDLLLKALGGALTDVPAANATWQGKSIRRYTNVDVSVAIATEDGLLSPVVRDLENLSLSALGRTMTDYKERASKGKLRQQELEGGSFSLTNLGMYGTQDFSAILNPPQAGILAVGVAETRPVVHDGALSMATIMSCTLSADHRVIDGAVSAQLLAAFKQRIEHPLRILL